MKNKKIIYIGLFFIIIVGIASSIHTIQNKPENIIKKFVKAIENKDGNLLCSLYAPDYISYMIGPGSFLFWQRWINRRIYGRMWR